jgi:predicted permease
VVLDGFVLDARSVARSLRRRPALVAAIVTLLGLGIAANTFFFAITDALLLRELPVRAPEQLFRVVQIEPRLGPRSDFNPPFLRALEEHARTLTQPFGWTEDNVAASFAGGPAERLRAGFVTGGYFSTLGIGAAIGRTITPADDMPAKANVVLLSHAYWQRRFHADPRVLGRVLHLNGHAFTIIGVTPASFTGLTIDTSPDLRVPLASLPVLWSQMEFNRPENIFFEVGARLRPGFSPAQARDEAAALYHSSLAGLDERTRAAVESRRIEMEPLARGVSSLRRQFRAATLALMAGVVFLMVMVCANVAGLLMARAASARLEHAVRQALGASRLRLLQLQLTESLLLGVGGLAVGLALSLAALPLLPRLLPPIRHLDATRLPLALQARLDWRVLLFTAALALLTVVAVGLTAALRGGREDLHALLRSARASFSTRGRSVLAVLQVAICTLLLASAALFWQTFRDLRNIDAGFDRDHVATFSVDPSLAAYTGAQSRALQQRLLDGVRAMPGVEQAAIASRGLMRGTGIKTTVAPVGQKAPRSDFLNTSINMVSPEYFDTLGLRLLEGRNLLPSDATAAKPRPVVVNQAFARRFFPGRSAVGRQFGVGVDIVAQPDGLIVGVVSDAHYRSLREPLSPIMYQLWVQEETGVPAFILHVRTHGRPEALIAAVEHLMHSIDARLPFFEITTLAEEVDTSLWRERLVAWLSLAFAALAALLSATALYGLLAFTVSQRGRELGIRAALGAVPARIVALVTREGLVLIAVGAVLGLAGAVLVAPWLAPLLTSAVHFRLPLALAVGAGVILIGCAALLAPAARAARTDPAAILHEE